MPDKTEMIQVIKKKVKVTIPVFSLESWQKRGFRPVPVFEAGTSKTYPISTVADGEGENKGK